MRLKHLGAILAVAAASHAVASARQGQPRGVLVRGRVIDAVTRQPVRGAVVRANSSARSVSNLPPASLFLTGQDGQFIFRDLPAGNIGLWASKTGYLGADGEQIGLAAGGQKTDAEVALMPEGLISGRVLDQSGEPVASATVRAIPRGDATPSRPVGSVVTDDLGNYLIGSLEPGTFVVGVDESRSGLRAHAAVFFPAAAAIIDASAIEVTSGTERTGVDVMVRLEPPVSQYRSKELLSDEPTAGTIGGTVKDVSGRGLPFATVLITRETTRETLTDESGRFQFTNVPPGQLRLMAARPGYVPLGLNDPAASWPWLDIDLAAAQRIGDVSVTLSRAPLVSGRLLDQFGDPLLGSVSLIRRSPTGTAGGQSVPTNARGQYRIANVLPGEYLLAVAQNPFGRDLRTIDESGQERDVAMLTTYYPSAADLALATPVTVGAGSDIGGLDVIVRPTPVTTISAVIEAGGRILRSGSVLLSTHGSGAAQRVAATADGTRATINSVPAGRFLLVASAIEVTDTPLIDVRSNRSQGLWATTEVTSDGVTPLTVTLVLEPGARVSGRVAYEGQGLSAQLIQPRLQPVGSGSRAPAQAGSITPNEFAIVDVQPGRYILTVGERGKSQVPWMVKSIVLDGQDIQDRPIDLAAGSQISNVVVTLTDQVTEISGTVFDLSGRPVSGGAVIAFSPDVRHWETASSRVRGAPVDAKGRYVIRGLPPGEYRLAAAGFALDLATLLPKLLPTAVTISLALGEHKVQDLRLRINVPGSTRTSARTQAAPSTGFVR